MLTALSQLPVYQWKSYLMWEIVSGQELGLNFAIVEMGWPGYISSGCVH
jgi:hypothetical protein